MLTQKDYCDYGLIVELEQLEMPIEIDFACGIENGQLVKTKFYPNPPSLYEAQKWLREEKNIVVRIIPLYEEGKAIKGMSYTNEVIHWDDGYVAEECTEEYDSYEEALLEGIKEAIKLLKEERK